MSEGSLNQDLIGMALSGYNLSSCDSLYDSLVTAYLAKQLGHGGHVRGQPRHAAGEHGEGEPGLVSVPGVEDQ